MLGTKISILLSSFSSGGTERAMLNLGSALAGKGVTVEFLLTKKEGEFLEEASQKFKIIDLQLSRTYELPFKLLRYIIVNRPDAVISNNWKQSTCACLARLMFPFFKLLVVEHGSPASNPSGVWFFSIVATVFYRLATKVVGVSTGVVDAIKQHTYGISEKLIVIYNAINSTGYKVIDPEKKSNTGVQTIITVGRLVPEKNQALLLNAFAIVIKRVEAQLVLVGVGPLENQLQKQAETLGVLEHVRFMGFHPRPNELLSESDLFVLTSDYEGLGNVLVEALFCGLPIVSTDCPSGPREVLMNGKYGTLTKMGDTTALAKAIIFALSSRKSPETQQQGAERFLPNKIADQYLSVLGFKK
jgi:glycosyltransferase involved in cell wall biosynthesis